MVDPYPTDSESRTLRRNYDSSKEERDMVDPNTTDSESRTLRRNYESSREGRRSVKFSAVPSSTLMRAIMAKHAASKSKMQRRTSKAAERAVPKLVFDYGPTTFRGLMLHRKIKIAPFAEHFQKKYPQIRVYYHPIDEYNTIIVRLKDCIVQRMLLSNVTYSTTDDITKNPFYKTINHAIQRTMQYPNLLIKPFKDAICLMTHNLDVDYDIPWYRTEFQRFLEPRSVLENASQALSILQNSSQAHTLVAAPCLVEPSTHWETFLKRVENHPGFREILEAEFTNSEELRKLKYK